MAEALKFIGNGYNAAMVFGIALYVLGLLSPKKFFGIEVDLAPMDFFRIMVFGIIFIIGSLVLRAVVLRHG